MEPTNLHMNDVVTALAATIAALTRDDLLAFYKIRLHLADKAKLVPLVQHSAGVMVNTVEYIYHVGTSMPRSMTPTQRETTRKIMCIMIRMHTRHLNALSTWYEHGSNVDGYTIARLSDDEYAVAQVARENIKTLLKSMA